MFTCLFLTIFWHRLHSFCNWNSKRITSSSYNYVIRRYGILIYSFPTIIMYSMNGAWHWPRNILNTFPDTSFENKSGTYIFQKKIFAHYFLEQTSIQNKLLELFKVCLNLYITSCQDAFCININILNFNERCFKKEFEWTLYRQCTAFILAACKLISYPVMLINN